MFLMHFWSLAGLCSIPEEPKIQVLVWFFGYPLFRYVLGPEKPYLAWLPSHGVSKPMPAGRQWPRPEIVKPANRNEHQHASQSNHQQPGTKRAQANNIRLLLTVA